MAWRIYRYNGYPSFWPAMSTVYVDLPGGTVEEYIVNEANVPRLVSSGGGGTGGGISRRVLTITSSTTAGATTGTDYVYLCDGTLTVILPTAVGNSNRYTVKNVGTGVVTINFTGSQNADGSTTLTLQRQNTSLDFISYNNLNWSII